MANFFTGYLAQGTGGNSGFVENTGTGYVRQAVTLTPLVNGAAALAAQTIFTAQAQVVVSQRALFDASTGGNLLMWWTLASPPTIPVGASDILKAGALSHTFPDLYSGIGTGTAAVEFLAGRRIGTTATGEYIYAGHFLTVSNGVVAAASSV